MATAVIDGPRGSELADSAWPFAVVSVVALGLAVAATRPMWTAVDSRARVLPRHTAWPRPGGRIRPGDLARRQVDRLSVERARADRCVGEISQRRRSGQPHGVDDPRDPEPRRPRRSRHFSRRFDRSPSTPAPPRGRRPAALRRLGHPGAARRRSAQGRRTRSRAALVTGRNADRLCPARIVGRRLAVRRPIRWRQPARSGRAARRDAHSLAGLVPRRALTSTSTTPSRRRTESRPRSIASRPRVDRWSRWCRPPGARSLPFPPLTARGLIYSANPHGVDLALWWRPFDGSEPTRLTTGVGEYAEASMTADGQTLISSLVQSRRALTLFSISGERLDAEPITSGSTGDFDPTLSPDGTRLVFTSSRSGFQNLWTSGPDGTMARALTSGNAFDEQPAFSPDGTRLAFVSDRGGRRSIWTMSADGGIPERLVDADVVDRLVWSRDGRRIVFAVTAGDTPTLQSVSVADGTIQAVRTPGPGRDSNRVCRRRARLPRAVPRRSHARRTSLASRSCGEGRQSGLHRGPEKPEPCQRLCCHLTRRSAHRGHCQSRRRGKFDLDRRPAPGHTVSESDRPAR